MNEEANTKVPFHGIIITYFQDSTRRTILFKGLTIYSISTR